MNKSSIFGVILKYARVPYKKFSSTAMAKSRYEYVKTFEMDDRILPNVWIIVRIDGRAFHKFTKIHDFEKPNDISALNLMNQAAATVMEEFPDVVLSFGQSDEYSFVFRKETDVYKRRKAKLLSYVTSLFTSSYVFNWNTWFPANKLQYGPSFDGRIVLYPTDQNLRDYLSWRQADVHINNLYNTAFWSLIQKGGLTNQEAENKLRGTLSADKNEILFSQFGINYNKINPMFRKGTILLRKRIEVSDVGGKRQVLVPLYEDLIRDKFWKENPEILGTYSPGDYVRRKYSDSEENCEELPEIVVRQLEKLELKDKCDKKSRKIE